MEITYTAPNYLWNVLSIALGIAAICFAIHSIAVKGCLTCCTLGFGCCAGALLAQLMELRRLIGIRDLTAIEDTLPARCLVAGILLLTVLALNLLALYRRGKNC